MTETIEWVRNNNFISHYSYLYSTQYNINIQCNTADNISTACSYTRPTGKKGNALFIIIFNLQLLLHTAQILSDYMQIQLPELNMTQAAQPKFYCTSPTPNPHWRPQEAEKTHPPIPPPSANDKKQYVCTAFCFSCISVDQ